MELKCIHFAGWITAEKISERPTRWLDTWFEAALKAHEEKCELLVFKVPSKDPQYNSQLLSEIENFLQQKLKTQNGIDTNRRTT